MVSVLLSALVERCFVSRLRDFFLYIVAKKNTRIGGKNHVITYFFFKMGHSTVDYARWIRLNHIWTIVLFLV